MNTVKLDKNIQKLFEKYGSERFFDQENLYARGLFAWAS